MYKICKTEQSARRQRELSAGLLSAMESQAYNDISISDLCKEMNIPRKTFYRYFSSKDGALYALLDHTLFEAETFLGHIGATAFQRTAQQDTEHFFQFWLEKKPLLDALARNGLSNLLIQRSIDFTMREHSIPHRFLDNVSLEMLEHVTIFCVCGLMSVVISWHKSGYRQSPQQMAQIATRLLTQPLFQNIERL